MTGKTLTAEGGVTANPSDVDALIGDLELDNDVGELDAGAEEAIRTVIAKDEAYADQPAGAVVEEPAATAEEAPAEPVSKPRTRRAKGTGAPKKAKIERDLTKLPVEVFQLDNAVPATEASRDHVIASRPSQKKIADKFDNLFQSIARGVKPSIYTMTCFTTLYAKGECTSGDLVAALQHATVSAGKSKGANYNIGTARSQAGQMMALFAAVGIANRDKNKLMLVKDSTIAAKLAALA